MLIAKGADGQLIGGPCAGSPRPSAQVRLVRSYAQWHLLHRARPRAERHGDSADSAYGLRETFYITLAFLDWIDRRDVDLASLTRHDDYSGQLRRFLHDPDLSADARVAGALILLYGCAPRRWWLYAAISTSNAGKAPNQLGTNPLLFPPPLASLLLQLAVRCTDRTVIQPSGSRGALLFRVSALVAPLRPARSAHACSVTAHPLAAVTPRV